MPTPPAEFAVGDGPEANFFLTLNGLANCIVFYEPQLARGNFSFVEFAPRLEQMLGAKQAADMVCTKRRFSARRISALLLVRCCETWSCYAPHSEFVFAIRGRLPQTSLH